MNLKKQLTLSLPSGVQQQTHQSQIFLSALIISKDTSHHEEKGIKPLSETLGINCNALPGGFGDRHGHSGCLFLPILSLPLFL